MITIKFTPCSWSFQTDPSKVCLKDQCTKIFSKPFSLILSHSLDSVICWLRNKIHWMTLVLLPFFLFVYTCESCISSHYCSFSFKHNLHKEEFIQHYEWIFITRGWVNTCKDRSWWRKYPCTLGSLCVCVFSIYKFSSCEATQEPTLSM